jgi:hypothetical protein
MVRGLVLGGLDVGEGRFLGVGGGGVGEGVFRGGEGRVWFGECGGGEGVGHGTGLLVGILGSLVGVDVWEFLGGVEGGRDTGVVGSATASIVGGLGLGFGGGVTLRTTLLIVISLHVKYI